MADSVREGKPTVKCSIQGCPGQYGPKPIVHTVTQAGGVLVFENVPAEVCDVCSDVLLSPETVRHIESLIRQRAKPEKYAPVYEYR